MYGFIYITTNAINDKKYVGMCSSVKRFKGYLGSGILLKQAIAKYGKENFTRLVLEECETEEQLRESERKWIDFYDAVNSEQFYNMCDGGRGGNTGTGRSTSEQTKKQWEKKSKEERSRIARQSVKNRTRNYKGDNNPMAGKSAVRGLKWYNNGSTAIYAVEGNQPSGFVLGRGKLKMFKEKKEGCV